MIDNSQPFIKPLVLGRLNLGFIDLTIDDVLCYSEKKTCYGRVFVSIKLFLEGKGILSEKKIAKLLENHPRKEEIFNSYFFLKTVFKIQSTVFEACKILNVEEADLHLDIINQKYSNVMAALGKKKSMVPPYFAKRIGNVMRSVTAAHEILIKQTQLQNNLGNPVLKTPNISNIDELNSHLSAID